MSDLRKSVQLFLDVFDHNDVRCNTAVNDSVNALRDALAEPSPIDALIAEIDGLLKREPYASTKSFTAMEIDLIIHKYRGVK